MGIIQDLFGLVLLVCLPALPGGRLARVQVANECEHTAVIAGETVVLVAKLHVVGAAVWLGVDTPLWGSRGGRNGRR